MKTLKLTQKCIILSKGDVETNDMYWDCECDQHYIHFRIIDHCPLCGAYQDESPNSRVNEIPVERLRSLDSPNPMPEPIYFKVKDDSWSPFGPETTIAEFMADNSHQVSAEDIAIILAMIVGEIRILGGGASGTYYVRRTR